MDAAKNVRIDRDGVFVDGVRIPGVVHADLKGGADGQRPSVTLRIETEKVVALQGPENAHLFDMEFDRWEVSRDGGIIAGHIETVIGEA